jgi:branched-chain amino acid aminotransferase
MVSVTAAGSPAMTASARRLRGERHSSLDDSGCKAAFASAARAQRRACPRQKARTPRCGIPRPGGIMLFFPAVWRAGMKVWLNGKLVDKRNAKLSVWDHGTLYGDGVFEGIRVYNGKVFQAQAHIDRLYESAKCIRLAIPCTKQELADSIYETLRANKMTDSYVRLVVTRGEGYLGLSPFQCSNPNVFIITDQIALYPQEMYENGMAVIIARTVRTAPRMLNPAIKSLNYLNNIMAKIESIDAGVAEAIMLNEQGQVAECTGDNIFIVKGAQVITPPTEAGILIGITRAVVMELAKKLHIAFAEKNIWPKDLYAAEECFLTGTAAEVIAVTKVDGKSIGDGRVGPVTRKLFEAFRQYIRHGNW